MTASRTELISNRLSPSALFERLVFTPWYERFECRCSIDRPKIASLEGKHHVCRALYGLRCMKFCVEIETMRRLGGWRSRCVTALLCAVSSTATGQLTFDHAPIHYSTTTPVDAIAKLQARLDDGDSRLAFDKEHGYLKSVLEELQISVSTQLLVFSKTSLQQHAIFPWSPRAIYYNDESYVGWVPGAAEIEISTVDPRQGAIFYTLRQRRSERPRFTRDRTYQ